MQQHRSVAIGRAGWRNIQIGHFQRLLLRGECISLDWMWVVEAFQPRAITGFLRQERTTGQGEHEGANALSHRDLHQSSPDGTAANVVGTYSWVTVGGRCRRVADDGWRPGSDACADLYCPHPRFAHLLPRAGRRAARSPRLVRPLICISRIFFLRARERQCKGMHPWSGFFRRCARWVEQHSAYDWLSIR